MVRNRIRFGVDVAREVDSTVEKLARIEGRKSKRNMHEVPPAASRATGGRSGSTAIDIGLIKPERQDAR